MQKHGSSGLRQGNTKAAWVAPMRPLTRRASLLGGRFQSPAITYIFLGVGFACVAVLVGFLMKTSDVTGPMTLVAAAISGAPTIPIATIARARIDLMVSSKVVTLLCIGNLFFKKGG